MIVNYGVEGQRKSYFAGEVTCGSAKIYYPKGAKVPYQPGAKTRGEEIVGKLISWATPLAYISALSLVKPIGAFAAPAVPVMAAAVSATPQEVILHAMDPLIELIKALSYPIAGVMIAGGCLFIMVQSKEKGMEMIRNAAIGYILVQLSPLFLKLLVGVATGL